MKVTISNRQREIRPGISKIERVSRQALSHLAIDAELSISLVTPEEMRELNLKWRAIDSTTDVLSFPMHELGGRPPFKIPEGEEPLLGDIVIDPLRAKEQAKEQGVSLASELERLLAHGILHLLGYDHEINDYQKRKMRAAQDALLLSLRS